MKNINTKAYKVLNESSSVAFLDIGYSTIALLYFATKHILGYSILHTVKFYNFAPRINFLKLQFISSLINKNLNKEQTLRNHRKSS